MTTSTVDKLNYLNDTKNAIKDAIRSKGQVVSDSDSFRSYATKIMNISSGDIVTATNNTGSAITAGEKVWINPEYDTNFTVVGNPTINYSTGIVSGFSTSNYLKLNEPFNPDNNTWEIVVKITTCNDVTTKQKITGANGTNFIVPTFYIENSKFGFQCSVDGSTWLFDVQGTHTIQTNTNYYIKTSWDGTKYDLYYSLDGTNYTLDASYTSSTQIYSNTNSIIVLGANNIGTVQHVFLGSIDLSETYINVNGVSWWTPTFAELSGYSLENFDKKRNFTTYGAPVIDDETSNIIIDSTGSYIQVNKLIDFSDKNSWEINIGAAKPYNLSSWQKMIIGGGINLGISNVGYLHLWLYSNGTSFIDVNITSANNLPRYAIYKLTYDGSTGYSFKYSTDDTTWNTMWTSSITTKITGDVVTNPYICFGNSDTAEYWSSILNLSKCSLYLNNELSWEAYTKSITENSLTGYAQENITSGLTGQVKTILPEE